MIEVICPTRGRPKYAAEMAASVFATARGEVQVTLGLDCDDPRLPEYCDIPKIIVDIGVPSRGATAAMNRMANNSEADYLQIMGDDCIMLTDGWDRLMVDAFPTDMIAIVSGLTKESTISRKTYHVAVTKKWVDIVGWLFDIELQHYGADDAIAYIAKKLNRIVWVDDVVVEHRHYRRNPEGIPVDAIYRYNESRAAEAHRILKARRGIYNEKIELLRAEMDVA